MFVSEGEFVVKAKKSVLFIAVLLGLLTVSLLYVYLSDISKRQEVKVDMRNTIIALNTIPAHVKVTAEMVTVKSIPVEAVHPESFTSVDQVIGATTKTEIVNGEQILASRVVVEGGEASLSYRIPENMRAIAIPMGEIPGVAGFIMAGDKIDILVSYDDPLINPSTTVYTQFQNIEVLEKGPYTTNIEEKQTGVASSITLLVTPSQAEVLVYANLSGTMHFTLRNPVDTNKVELQNFSSENFITWKVR